MGKEYDESIKGQIKYAESAIYQYKIKIRDAEEYIIKLEMELCQGL